MTTEDVLVPMLPSDYLPYVRNLEELAANAWPAPVVQLVDGWRLRYGWGVTHRANSVLTTTTVGDVTLADKIELAEDFYLRRRRPPMFAITDATVPEDLDALLADRGYDVEAPCTVRIAGTDEVLGLPAPSTGSLVTLNEKVTEEWTHLWWALRTGGTAEGDGEVVGRVILESTGPRTVFATAWIDGKAVAVGRATVERGWGGLTAIAVEPTFRGLGLGSRLVVELARWCADEGATALYLQVEDANEAALALFEKAGFTVAYRYWYRVHA